MSTAYHVGVLKPMPNPFIAPFWYHANVALLSVVLAGTLSWVMQETQSHSSLFLHVSILYELQLIFLSFCLINAR